MLVAEIVQARETTKKEIPTPKKYHHNQLEPMQQIGLLAGGGEAQGGITPIRAIGMNGGRLDVP